MSTRNLHRDMPPEAQRIAEEKTRALGALLADAVSETLEALQGGEESVIRNDALSVVSQLASMAVIDLILRLGKAHLAATDAQLIEAALRDVQLRVITGLRAAMADIEEAAH